jgi:hypothetical protein
MLLHIVDDDHVRVLLKLVRVQFVRVLSKISITFCVLGPVLRNKLARSFGEGGEITHHAALAGAVGDACVNLAEPLGVMVVESSLLKTT